MRKGIKMYKCLNCEARFDEPRVIRTTQANLFGLPRLNDSYIDSYVCPYCGCDEFESEDEEDE